MTTDRRHFLTASACGLALAGTAPGEKEKEAVAAVRPNRIAISTYSYWQFRHKDRRDIETCIDLAADMGFDGVEILHRQMTDETNGAMQKIKRRAFLAGQGVPLPDVTAAAHGGTEVFVARFVVRINATDFDR